MTAPRWVLIDIAMAVQKQGGDMEDVRDLLAVWVRLHGDLPATCRHADEGQDHPACERRSLPRNRPRRPNRRMREGRA